MEQKGRISGWVDFIKLFSRSNIGRPTRIGVYAGSPDSMEDYWLEDGLPLQGLDIESDHAGSITLQIVLGGNGRSAMRHFTHVVRSPRLLKFTLSMSGEADGLEINDSDGKTTVLLFEG